METLKGLYEVNYNNDNIKYIVLYNLIFSKVYFNWQAFSGKCCFTIKFMKVKYSFRLKSKKIFFSHFFSNRRGKL